MLIEMFSPSLFLPWNECPSIEAIYVLGKLGHWTCVRLAILLVQIKLFICVFANAICFVSLRPKLVSLPLLCTFVLAVAVPTFCIDDLF